MPAVIGMAPLVAIVPVSAGATPKLLSRCHSLDRTISRGSAASHQAAANPAKARTIAQLRAVLSTGIIADSAAINTTALFYRLTRR
jgi:hypothetical protein